MNMPSQTSSNEFKNIFPKQKSFKKVLNGQNVELDYSEFGNKLLGNMTWKHDLEIKFT